MRWCFERKKQIFFFGFLLSVIVVNITNLPKFTIYYAIPCQMIDERNHGMQTQTPIRIQMVVLLWTWISNFTYGMDANWRERGTKERFDEWNLSLFWLIIICLCLILRRARILNEAVTTTNFFRFFWTSFVYDGRRLHFFRHSRTHTRVVISCNTSLLFIDVFPPL